MAKRISTPSKPSARKAAPAAKPSKPSLRKPKASAKAPAAKPSLRKPNRKAPKAAAPSSDLTLELAAAKTQIAKLTKAVAKARVKRSNVRTVSETLEGITLSKRDWRTEYHAASADGFRITMLPHNILKDSIEIIKDGSLPVDHCMLAMPRDNDVGGQGGHARAKGHLAIHWESTEARDAYNGQPSYVTADELAELWVE